MARLKFIGLFTLSHAATGINKGGVSLWCGLRPFVVVWRHFHVAGRNFERNPPTLKKKKKKKNTVKRFSSSLNVMVGYLCVQSLPEWAWMFVSVVERQRALLEDGCHHTVVWQRYCRKLTFRACRPQPDFMLAGMCVTWLHSRGNDRE